ncbi:SUZ domain-containing protein 1 isoform X3 [Orussus abietinus]|nr:SUZ domain-containing protein 1 isoform X3 [Orussus abietinus]
MIILGEDAVRSQYVPPKPTVKILKRPTRDSQGSGDGPLMNGDSKPKQPIKSLKQREQEYAEARKRILGEERSPEERPVQEVSKVQSKAAVSGSSSSSSLPINVVRMPIGPDGTRGFNLSRSSVRLTQMNWHLERINAYMDNGLPLVATVHSKCGLSWITLPRRRKILFSSVN